MNLLGKKSFAALAVLISGLAISFYIVQSKSVLAQRSEEEPASLSGLVSRWNGSNLSGAVVSDIGGGENSGTMSSGVTVVKDENGEDTFKFNGSSGRIDMGNPANLNFGTEPFSLETWFMWDGGGSDVNNIIRKSNYPVSGPGAGYWLRVGRDSRILEFSIGATTGPEGQSFVTAPISPHVWHYVVATRDSSDEVALYVDGESRGTIVRQAAKAETTSESPFVLGAWVDRFGPSEFFSGLIGEASVYNRALSELEVRMIAAIWRGDGPGGCKTETECRAYCEKSEHSRDCLAFVKKYHLASPEEIAKWEKFIDIVENGGPGGCKNESDCVSYCEDSAHIVECTDFVAKYDLVPPQELAEMRKIAKAVKAGAKMPGNCHGKDDCVLYCEEPAHSEECATFLEKAELISHTDAEFMRKSHGKSPGDCAKGLKSPEEGKKACSAFCAKAENQQVCMDFAVEIGMISHEDAKELSGGGSLEDFNACVPYMDDEMRSCFDNILGKDMFEKLKAGDVPDDLESMKEMVKKMKDVRACLNKNTDKAFANLKESPETVACLEKIPGGNPIERMKSGKLSCREIPKMQEEMQACFIGPIQAQLDVCLGLSCSEVLGCFQKLGMGQHEESRKGSQMEPSPALKQKMDAVKEKISSCVVEQIRACLSKDCGEMMTCINKLQGQEGEQKGGEQGGGESNMDQALKQEITAKMTGCMKQGGGQQGGGTQGLGAEECTKQGGVWNGAQCDFSTKGIQNADECTKQGGIWNGAQCDFSAKGNTQPGAATECTKQGGTWNGAKCNFPAPPTSGDQSQVPQGYTSWQAFCTAQPSDSRCTAYAPQIDCSIFAQVPSCSYVGAPDSQNYKYCKQCFPDK